MKELTKSEIFDRITQRNSQTGEYMINPNKLAEFLAEHEVKEGKCNCSDLQWPHIHTGANSPFKEYHCAFCTPDGEMEVKKCKDCECHTPVKGNPPLKFPAERRPPRQEQGGMEYESPVKECHICHCPKDEEGNINCSFPHPVKKDSSIEELLEEYAHEYVGIRHKSPRMLEILHTLKEMMKDKFAEGVESTVYRGMEADKDKLVKEAYERGKDEKTLDGLDPKWMIVKEAKRAVVEEILERSIHYENWEKKPCILISDIKSYLKEL